MLTLQFIVCPLSAGAMLVVPGLICMLKGVQDLACVRVCQRKIYQEMSRTPGVFLRECVAYISAAQQRYDEHAEYMLGKQYFCMVCFQYVLLQEYAAHRFYSIYVAILIHTAGMNNSLNVFFPEQVHFQNILVCITSRS